MKRFSFICFLNGFSIKCCFLTVFIQKIIIIIYTLYYKQIQHYNTGIYKGGRLYTLAQQWRQKSEALYTPPQIRLQKHGEDTHCANECEKN